jgi:molybdopterin/thiamine biosynthesis adenylyltransferase
MNSEKHIRIKPNLFLVEDESVLCFQKTYGDGIEFPNNVISTVFLKALRSNTSYTKIVNELRSGTGLPPEQIEVVLKKWVELGLLEYFTDQKKIDESTELYSRQIAFFDALQPLPDNEGNISRQEKLSKAHIIIIGIGGIGNYAALSFTVMGIGKITLVDGDKVERSNLSRQVIFKGSDIGSSKTKTAITHLKTVNPKCQFNEYPINVHSEEILEEIIKNNSSADLVFISADKPLTLPYWANDLADKHGFSFITCSYQSYTGFVGPIISGKGKRYEEIIPKRKQVLDGQSALVEKTNASFQHPSSSASNAILANMAVLESIKHILGIGRSNVLERRCVFNLNTFEMRYE